MIYEQRGAKKPRQCIHLSWSNQVLMIKAEWAAGRPTQGEAEPCFELALGADVSWKLVWKGLLTANSCPPLPYGVFWEDLWFRSINKGASTAPPAEAGMVLEQVQPVCWPYVLVRKDVKKPRNTGAWKCQGNFYTSVLAKLKLQCLYKQEEVGEEQKSLWEVGGRGAGSCILCPPNGWTAQGTWGLAVQRAEEENWTRATPARGWHMTFACIKGHVARQLPSQLTVSGAFLLLYISVVR